MGKEPELLDVALTLNSEFEDWYTIERAEHDGRTWLEQVSPNGYALRCSSRIGNADIEGTADHMLAIAKAIRERGIFSAKRCAVSVQGDVALLQSPRNSRSPTAVPLARADALADEIERVLS